MNTWLPYIIAAGVGLLVGIEREKAHPTDKSMGVRTLLLLSLLGAVAGGLDEFWLSLLIAGFCFILIVISYFNASKARGGKVDRGLTTEFAGGIVFCLGYAAHAQPTLSALLGPVVAVVLFSKKSLHRFTHRLKSSELQAALVLLLLAVCVLSLVPDEVIDPWGIFNPRKFGLLVVTLAAIEFFSYAAAKIFGEKRSAWIIGFLGGLVSSTAVLLSSARHAAKSPKAWPNLAIAAIASKCASLVMLILIVGLVSRPLALKVAPAFAAALAVGALALLLLSRRSHQGGHELELKSPLDWKGVLRLSVLLAAILAASEGGRLLFGVDGIMLVSFLTGLFELHGVALANATMFTREHVDFATAERSMYVAGTASLFGKIAIVWIVMRGKFAVTVSLTFALMGGALWLSTLVL
ncbi:MAG TPA: MgtC/SapB family protein [Bdellovibrionales bacterium]|nr:MgtC/SapB family protein [Bdellovibrionales bacterium]